MSEFSTPLDAGQIEANFADINPPMTPAQAAAEANRCLYCYDAPCMHACPTHIDVPAFIKKIASGNLTGSARVIFDANPIGATCARVCPVEALCEGACVEKTLLKKPIEIGRLQRHATDHLINTKKSLFHPAPSNGLSVAVIGSGPAGLSGAAYLARLGYAVTVYDRREKAGGLNTYGMAEYKMTQADSEAEIGLIRQLGIKFRLGTEITASENGPSSIRFSDLLEANDAVFLGVGLGKTNRLNIPGEDLEGVLDALEFIEKVKSRDWASVPLGKRVAVIGAGNTAIDAVTQAKRLGAERAMIVYRRTEADAPAYDYELELAKADGIEFHWQMTPVEIIGNGSANALRCDSPGGETIIECDLVIKAIGQTKMSAFFTEICGITVDEKGRVIVNNEMQTSDPRIFAGGDCVNGGAEAVDAAQMGKLAARAIHAKLTGEIAHFAGADVSRAQPVRSRQHG
ncbi:MAG TPA: NAD(P)-dependent oxidoreductase [Pyrinomonadaceae bacterium]|nr:NAD(P)-dependent oxidoreductase [Pyrinomonadaceae bacterium]HMP65899.1 NAD(P)-dependent oxidoreductase [Pyrinomonadaceae bacterium]